MVRNGFWLWYEIAILWYEMVNYGTKWQWYEMVMVRNDQLWPKQLVEFNSDYQKDVSQHIDLIREIINNMDSDVIPISHYEVTVAITKLNNKKSGDEFGISAEHCKLAGQSIVAALVELFNAILEHVTSHHNFYQGL